MIASASLTRPLERRVRFRCLLALASSAFLILAPATARADCALPDVPSCACYAGGGQWPLAEVPGDVVATARGLVGAATSCLVHRGQPYWQVQLQIDSPDLSEFVALVAPGIANVFPPQAWCTEAVALWHREAQVPYPEGYQSFLWPTTFVQNVNTLRTWYEAEDWWRTYFGGNTRGRWINGGELDYAHFIPGVNGPCPGAYQALDSDPTNDKAEALTLSARLYDSVGWKVDDQDRVVCCDCQ